MNKKLKYYGQKNLDRYIHKEFIPKPIPDGTFLELGAIDGVVFNNTKFFEDNMGFSKGILIEPYIDAYNKLIKNRPNSYNFNYAIHSTLDEVVILRHWKHHAVTCVKSESTEGFRKRWHRKSKEILVPATTLSSIISRTDIEYIDFWTLDVEGPELECLRSMNWSIPVGLLCIEISRQHEEIDILLRNHGLELIDHRRQGAGGNSFYFNKNYFRKQYFSIEL